MQIFMPSCMTQNCALHYSNKKLIMLVASSKWGKGNDLYFVVTGDMCPTLN